MESMSKVGLPESRHLGLDVEPVRDSRDLTPPLCLLCCVCQVGRGPNYLLALLCCQQLLHQMSCCLH